MTRGSSGIGYEVTALAALSASVALALIGCAGTGSAAARAERPCADTVRVAETRIVTAEDADKLTLGTAIDRMSQSLLRAPEGTAWKPEAARAIEVRDNRTDLSILVEDAEWVLALSSALDGPLPAADKTRLRRLHERYAARAPHAEVAAQVAALLEDVRDEALRRDLKKLANRSWERERRRGVRNAAEAAKSSVAPAPPLAAIPVDTASRAPSDSSAAVSPERYCAERRSEAASAFAEARNAGDATAKSRLLRQSLASLDACISRFPDAAEAAKARQNRERVSGELKR